MEKLLVKVCWYYYVCYSFKPLSQLCPDRDVLGELGGPFDKDAWLAKGAKGISALPTPSMSRGGRPHPLPPPLTPVDDEELDHSDNEVAARSSQVSRDKG